MSPPHLQLEVMRRGPLDNRRGNLRLGRVSKFLSIFVWFDFWKFFLSIFEDNFIHIPDGQNLSMIVFWLLKLVELSVF